MWLRIYCDKYTLRGPGGMHESGLNLLREKINTQLEKVLGLRSEYNQAPIRLKLDQIVAQQVVYDREDGRMVPARPGFSEEEAGCGD